MGAGLRCTLLCQGGNGGEGQFGPQTIRRASRHLRTHYHPAYDVEPFMLQQVVDAGDMICNPYHINQAIEQIEAAATELLDQC
jgi:agmatinase